MRLRSFRLVVTTTIVLAALVVTSAADGSSATTPSPSNKPTHQPPGKPAQLGIAEELVVGGYGSDGVVITSWADSPKARKLATVHSPTFISVDRVKKVFYVTSETSGAKINLFAITYAGKVVSALNSGGVSPVRSAISGDRLAVANYDGSIALFALTKSGAIARPLSVVKTAGSGPDVERQDASHPHSVTFGPDGTTLWAADLGADVVMRFDLGRTRNSLTERERISMTPGSGPRQVLVGRDNLLYVAAELDGYVDLLVVSGPTTRLLRRVLVRPKGRIGEVLLSPSRRWMIALSRATSECVVFAVDGDQLHESSQAPCGNGPRHASFSTDGRELFVAAQASNEVKVLGFDDRTGKLVETRSLPFSKPAVVYPIG